MKKTSLILSLLFFSNCAPENGNENSDILSDPRFEKEHSELVTGIHIPENYTFISGVDSNFIRITILDLDKKECAKFYKANDFKAIKDTFPQSLACMNYLDCAYRNLPDNKKLLLKKGINNRTYWTYLLDTSACRLYCHISFPDYNGHTK